MISALALMFVVQACATGVASDSPGEPPTGLQAANLHAAAESVDQLGKRFPAHYAGLELLNGKVVVYRRASTDFDEALRNLYLPVEVVARDAPYSAADLQRLVERISGDFAYWRDLGVPISSVGAQQNGTAVAVGTDHPDQLSRLIVQRYGSVPPVVVSRESLVPAPMPPR